MQRRHDAGVVRWPKTRWRKVSQLVSDQLCSERARCARELDPLNLRTSALEAQFLVHAGRIDEALARLQKTFELDPNFWFAHLFASSAYIEKGMFAEAVAEARKASDLFSPSTHPIAFLGYALAKSGKQAEARTVLEELLKRSTEHYVPPYHIALIYNGLGERAEALAWLERSYRERDPKMVFLKVEPKWNNLRDDPRFKRLDAARRLSTIRVKSSLHHPGSPAYSDRPRLLSLQSWPVN